jgi:hypothetical protein
MVNDDPHENAVIPRYTTQEKAAELSEEEWKKRYGRPNALLSETDRRFLLGLKEYENKRSISERRGIIRERYMHGILDLLLLNSLTDRQYGMLLDDLDKSFPSGELESATSRFIELLYCYTEGNTGWIEERIKTGITAGYRRTHNHEFPHDIPDVEVEIHVAPPHDLDEIEERFRTAGPNALTPAEKWLMIEHRDVPSGELEDRNPTMGTADPDLSDVDPDANAFDSPFSDEE